jgi:toxin YoeB
VLNLEFITPKGFEDFEWWVKHDRKMTDRLFKLMDSARKTPFEGIGKPEALKYDMRGCWSRRIDEAHRLVLGLSQNQVKAILGVCSSLTK